MGIVGPTFTPDGSSNTAKELSASSEMRQKKGA
jgi:hypothetical protein